MSRPIDFTLKKVYFISGLGADRRVFSFLDLSFCEPVFIDWITPLKNESLASYALRLRKEIPGEAPVIIGISFGGMLLTEMAKEETAIKAIIISSSKSKRELPLFLKIGKYLPLYKLSPSQLLKKIAVLFKGMFSAKGKEQKKVLSEIIADTDPHFLKWAIGAILNWNNEVTPKNLIHIHGSADKLLPYKHIKADHTIEDGAHLMVMDKHDEISSLLRQLIAG